MIKPGGRLKIREGKFTPNYLLPARRIRTVCSSLAPLSPPRQQQGSRVKTKQIVFQHFVDIELPARSQLYPSLQHECQIKAVRSSAGLGGCRRPLGLGRLVLFIKAAGVAAGLKLGQQDLSGLGLDAAGFIFESRKCDFLKADLVSSGEVAAARCV
jgi:hypothetical protein